MFTPSPPTVHAGREEHSYVCTWEMHVLLFLLTHFDLYMYVHLYVHMCLFMYVHTSK